MKKTRIIILCFLFISCHSGVQKNDSVKIKNIKDTIFIADNSAINKKIQLIKIENQQFSSEFKTTGTVRAISGKIADVSVPFDGRIVKSFVKLGQKVNKGTPIVEFSSTEFYEITKQYFQSLQNRNLKERSYKRQKDLVNNGVGSQKELEEIQMDYENAKKEYESELARLRLFNVDVSKLTMGQPLRITSPINGDIVKNNIVIGQYVKSDSEPIAVVADISKVWVIALVKEKYIGSIKLNDKAEIYTDVSPNKTIWGKIFHVGEILDEGTRSIEVIIECDNKDKELKPGMFASIHFQSSLKESILIPSSAILQSESGSYVFVQIGKGKYKKRLIKTETAKQGMSLVTDGLEEGEIIISKGGIYLTEE